MDPFPEPEDALSTFLSLGFLLPFCFHFPSPRSNLFQHVAQKPNSPIQDPRQCGKSETEQQKALPLCGFAIFCFYILTWCSRNDLCLLLVQLGENRDARVYFEVQSQPKPHEDVEAVANPQTNFSKCFDDDGRLKRSGT